MILDFLRDNWRFVVEVSLLVLSTLVVIFKKKTTIKLTSSDYDTLFAGVPGLINEAESIYGAGHGEEKLKYVVREVFKIFCEVRGYELKKVPGALVVQITDFIESVLSTPKKKEVFPCIKED